MAGRKKNALAIEKDTPRSVALADKGIHTGADFTTMMSALLSDTIAGRVDPQISNAACNISGKILKVVELQFKYGKPVDGMNERLLAITPMGAQSKDAVQ